MRKMGEFLATGSKRNDMSTAETRPNIVPACAVFATALSTPAVALISWAWGTYQA